MGYLIKQRQTQFRIAPSNFDATLVAIKGLAGSETISDAGGRHFAWVDSKSFLNATQLSQAMDAWRWGIEVNETGEITDLCFQGQKLGDDKILFDAIAPFVEEGSFIEILGEDGLLWRWVFDGSKCKEVTPNWG